MYKWVNNNGFIQHHFLKKILDPRLDYYIYISVIWSLLQMGVFLLFALVPLVLTPTVLSIQPATVELYNGHGVKFTIPGQARVPIWLIMPVKEAIYRDKVLY